MKLHLTHIQTRSRTLTVSIVMLIFTLTFASKHMKIWVFFSKIDLCLIHNFRRVLATDSLRPNILERESSNYPGWLIDCRTLLFYCLARMTLSIWTSLDVAFITSFYWRIVYHTSTRATNLRRLLSLFRFRRSLALEARRSSVPASFLLLGDGLSLLLFIFRETNIWNLRPPFPYILVDFGFFFSLQFYPPPPGLVPQHRRVWCTRCGGGSEASAHFCAGMFQVVVWYHSCAKAHYDTLIPVLTLQDPYFGFVCLEKYSHFEDYLGRCLFGGFACIEGAYR